MCDNGNTMTVTVITAVVCPPQHQATNNTASRAPRTHASSNVTELRSDGGLEKDKQVKKAMLFKNRFPRIIYLSWR